MNSEIPSYTIVKPCGLVPALDGDAGTRHLVASHDDEYLDNRDISRGDLASVLLHAVQMPDSAANLRFDLCSDPTRPADGDWTRLFADARRVAAN